MRSALLTVKGVTRVQVSLETGEAVVTYDPPATPQAMINAIDTATPEGPLPYKAAIKGTSRPPGSAQ